MSRYAAALGMIFLLTPASGQTVQLSAPGPSVGAHFGFGVGGDYAIWDERAGVQMIVPIARPLSLGVSVARLFEFPINAGGTVDGWGWRSIITLRTNPLGPDTFLTVGAGLTAGVFHRGPEFMLTGSTWVETTGVLMGGVEIPLGPIRPFADLYLSTETFAGALASVGLNLAVF